MYQYHQANHPLGYFSSEDVLGQHDEAGGRCSGTSICGLQQASKIGFDHLAYRYVYTILLYIIIIKNKYNGSNIIKINNHDYQNKITNNIYPTKQIS